MSYLEVESGTGVRQVISFVLTGSTTMDPTAQELSLSTRTLYMVATIFALPPVTSLFANGIGRRKTIIVVGILFATAITMQVSAASISYPAVDVIYLVFR
jgi:hypothetical protein